MIRIFYESLIVLICSYLLNCKGIKIPEKSLHVSNGDIKIISLSNYSTSILEEQAFMHLININNNTNFIIHISDIPEKVSFIIIQVHTYVYSVLLSYDRNIIDEVPGKYVNGTNIGLFIETNKNNTEVYVTNKNSFIVHGLIAVVAYTKNAPYPGGCNMEFNIEKSPFQKLVYNKDIIIVDAQPASIPIIGNIQPLCENHPVQHDTYRMYISEHDFSKESYFLSISQMLTVQSIKKNANFIPMSLFGSKMRRMYSLYPGTGSVYGMVSHIANYSSAYVPIFTYGYAASPLSTTDKVFSILSFILGVFLATCGSYYNDISMFFMTMMLGAYFGYIFIIILSSYTGIVVTDILLLAIFLGILASLLWFFLRLKSTIPSMVVLVITLGTFLFNIFYFTIPVGMLYLEHNAYFWLIYIVFIMLVMMFHVIIPLGNNFCFSLIGAYATVFSIDIFVGSYLKYILINGIRRAIVSNFNIAVIQPPYQYKDILLTIFWIFLATFKSWRIYVINWTLCRYCQIKNGYVEEVPLLQNERTVRYRSG